MGTISKTGGLYEFNYSQTTSPQAEKFKRALLEEHNKKLKQWKKEKDRLGELYHKEITNWKKDNEKLKKEFKDKIDEWNKKKLIYKIFLFLRKPKLILKPKPKKPHLEKPQHPLED